MIQKIDPSPAFHRIIQACLYIVFMSPRRTYVLSIPKLACPKADIEPVLYNMNLSYLALNYPSMTRLKQFVYRCQMHLTAKS